MKLEQLMYPSNLLPAAPVAHGYKNVWIRDLYYVGICSEQKMRKQIWAGMISILDKYKWKLEIHAKKSPEYWFENIHVRYNPLGDEITHEHWLHNQWDAIGNWLEVCIDEGRDDLASLLVDYLDVVEYSKRPSAGAWEDRNTCDAYSLAACIHALQRSKKFLPHKAQKIDNMVKQGSQRLYGDLLPYASNDKLVCLSLLGVIWPFDLAGPYKQEIIDLVCKKLKKRPFGFARYVGDTYDGEHFSRGVGTEIPWLLGDLFMREIEPHNNEWQDRIIKAKENFGCMPEAYFPENLQPNRNTPLVWAEAMYLHSL